MFENKSKSIDSLFPNCKAKAVPPTNTKESNYSFCIKDFNNSSVLDSTV